MRAVLLLALIAVASAAATEWIEPELMETPAQEMLEQQQAAHAPLVSNNFAQMPRFAQALPEDSVQVRRGDVLQGQGGFQAPLQRGLSFPPGNYYPPQVPYRYPSYPYDNPSYTPYPSMFPVPLPPAWRSDPLNMHSDGARYLKSMSQYDYFGVAGGAGAAPAAQNTGGDDA